MSDFMNYAYDLADGIGPRSANTEEEHQAALQIADWFSAGGVEAEVEEFECPTMARWPYLVAYLLMFVAALLTRLRGAAAAVMFIIALIALGLFLCERYLHPVFGSMLGRGLSQNVLAKVKPEGASSKRSRKVIVMARYDSSHSALESSPLLLRFRRPVRIVVLACMVLLPVLMLFQLIPGLRGARNVLWAVSLVLSLVPLAGAVFIIVRRFALHFPDGANDNASGVAAMMEVFNRLQGISDDAADEQQEESSEGEPEIHDKEQAYAADVVPDVARLNYVTSRRTGREDGEDAPTAQAAEGSAKAPTEAAVQERAPQQQKSQRQRKGEAPASARHRPRAGGQGSEKRPPAHQASRREQPAPARQGQTGSAASSGQQAPHQAAKRTAPASETPDDFKIPGPAPKKVAADSKRPHVVAEGASVKEASAAPAAREASATPQTAPSASVQAAPAEASASAARSSATTRRPRRPAPAPVTPGAKRPKPSWWTNVENRRKEGEEAAKERREPSGIRSVYADMPVLPQEPRRPVAPAPAEIETPAEQAQQQDAWPAPAAVMPAEPASAAPSQAQAPVPAPAASSADADTTAQSVPVPAASEEHIDESTRAFLEMNGMLAPEPVREPGAEAASEAAESEPADQQAQPQPEVAAPEVQAPAITPQLEERPAPAPVVQQPAPQPAPADVEPASARPDAQAASGRVRRQAAPANFELEKTAEHAPVRSTTTTISARRRPEDRDEQNAPSQVFKAERPESRRPVRAAAPAPAPADEIEDEATPFETADDTSAYERDDQYPYDEQREDDTYVADAYEDEDEWPEEQKESWGTRLKKRFRNFRANHRRDKDVEGVDDEDAFYDEEQEQPVDYVDEREQPASETDLQDYEDYQNDDDDESYVEEDFDAEAEVIVAEITGKHKPVVLDELDQPEKTAELSPVSSQDEEASAAAVRQSVPAEDEGGSQADSDVEAAAYDEPREAPARQEGQAMRPQSEPQEALEGDAGSDSDEAHGTETAPDAQEESDVQFASEPADDHREPEGAREVEAVEKRPRHIPEVRTEQPRERQRSGDRKPTPRKSVRDRNIPHVGITGEMSPVNGRRPTRKNQRLAGIPQVERPDDVERVPSRPAAEQANFEASAAEDVERVAPASTSSSRPAGEDRRSRRHSRKRAEEDAWEDLADGADISDDDWKGGAASTHDPTAAAREKMRKDVAEMATREAPAKRPPKEVWFLAVGASEQDNAGVKAFLAAHADELRGATFINLRAVGAGTLAALKSEGVGPAGARSDHRSQTLARRAAKASGHEFELRDAPAFVTDAVPVLHSRHRAITLMAFDGSAPVAWEQSGDTSDVLEENTIRAAADIVEKMVR